MIEISSIRLCARKYNDKFPGPYKPSGELPRTGLWRGGGGGSKEGFAQKCERPERWRCVGNGVFVLSFHGATEDVLLAFWIRFTVMSWDKAPAPGCRYLHINTIISSWLLFNWQLMIPNLLLWFQCACCWFSVVALVALLSLIWMYICWVTFNDQEDVNWWRYTQKSPQPILKLAQKPRILSFISLLFLSFWWPFILLPSIVPLSGSSFRSWSGGWTGSWCWSSRLQC